MSTIDQQFVEYIVKTLVNNPEEVHVAREIDEKGVLLTLTVDPEDVGRIIGRRGATAQSLRTLLRALGTKNDARYNLKIVNDSDLGEDAELKLAEDAVAATETAIAASELAEEASELADVATDMAAKTRQELADLDDLEV